MIRLGLVSAVVAMIATGSITAKDPSTPEPMTAGLHSGALPGLRGPAVIPTSEPPAATVEWAPARLEDRLPTSDAEPVAISIPALDVEADVVGLGLDREGRMDVPDNVSDVGWYRFGSTPGQAGSAVLAAHVDLAGSGPGVFFHLDRMDVGDAVTIGMSDGSAIDLVVTQVEHVAKSSLDTGRLFRRDGSPEVRLVTCGGVFDAERRSYADNVVVTLASEREDR